MGIKTRIPKDLLHRVMPIAIKEALSMRQLIMMISAVAIICKIPLSKLYLSLTTAQREKRKQTADIGHEALEAFSNETKLLGQFLVAHWDEKLMFNDLDGKMRVDLASSLLCPPLRWKTTSS